MKYYFILGILIFCFYNSVTGQYIKVSGVVTDKSTSVALPEASIYVKGNGLGIFTNQDGVFELNVPTYMVGDTLVFSYIGYESRYLLIKEAIETVNIELDQENRILAEVSILADTSFKIIEKALSLIDRNYPRKAYYQEGFYRELSMKDNEYVRIIEAAVGIRDKSYMSFDENRKIKVIAIRKSEDYIERSLISRITDKLYGDENRNTLIRTLHFADFIRSYSSKKYLLEGHGKNKFSENYAFKLKETTFFNGEKAYVIEFSFPAEAKRDDVLGEIIINATDFGIIKFNYKFGDSVDKLKINDKRWRNSLNSVYYQYSAFYRKIGNKYYLSKVSGVFPINFAGLKDNGTSGYQFYYTDLVINDTFFKRRDFERIKNRTKIRNENSLYDSDFEYDPTFWETYNKTIIDPLIKKAKQDMEHNKSEKQK